MLTYHVLHNFISPVSLLFLDLELKIYYDLFHKLRVCVTKMG